MGQCAEDGATCRDLTWDLAALVARLHVEQRLPPVLRAFSVWRAGPRWHAQGCKGSGETGLCGVVD